MIHIDGQNKVFAAELQNRIFTCSALVFDAPLLKELRAHYVPGFQPLSALSSSHTDTSDRFSEPSNKHRPSLLSSQTSGPEYKSSFLLKICP